MKNIFKGNPDESLGYLVSRVFGLRQKKMNEELAEINLNYAQYNLLMGLYWLQLQGETINQMMLISHTKLDKSVVSNILRQMANDKIVIRRENPNDTRAKVISLTAKGEDLAAQAIQIINRVDETFWGNQPQESICQFFNDVLNLNS